MYVPLREHACAPSPSLGTILIFPPDKLERREELFSCPTETSAPKFRGKFSQEGGEKKTIYHRRNYTVPSEVNTLNKVRLMYTVVKTFSILRKDVSAIWLACLFLVMQIREDIARLETLLI